MGVASADDERERGKLHWILAGDGVDVSFDVVHGDEGKVVHHRERLRVGDPDQERPDQAGSLGDGDGCQVF